MYVSRTDFGFTRSINQRETKDRPSGDKTLTEFIGLRHLTKLQQSSRFVNLVAMVFYSSTYNPYAFAPIEVVK